MAPPRHRNRTPETPTNEQLAQNPQHLTQITQTLSNALLHNNNNPPPPPPNANRDVGRQVSGHRPSVFAGEEDPAILEESVRTLDKIFSVVGCPEERRVELPTLYFSHEADLWWVHEGPGCQEESRFCWERLKDKLRERFYPSHVQAALYEEFLHIKQGALIVVEYHKRFLKLSCFTQVLVPTEAALVEKFVAEFNYEARKSLMVFKPRTLEEAYSSAANLFRIQQMQRGSSDQTKRRIEWSGNPNFKRAIGDYNSKVTYSQGQEASRTHSEARRGPDLCRRCGKEHVRKDCQGNPLQCFNCGRRGHKVCACPYPVEQGGPPQHHPSARTPAADSSSPAVHCPSVARHRRTQPPLSCLRPTRKRRRKRKGKKGEFKPLFFVEVFASCLRRRVSSRR
ncbi:PREDICTED: uncharacterized protein LOC109168302 [Ipomoea nil]|uniref:uncharacterized protein LOC109168302 n=1 Tax=Ipomoea nil TaxID=35883 RepID=UPI000901B368|nr:PREDICTED: uncharacterized protein LOC109168302 [Ipomoea nil]